MNRPLLLSRKRPCILSLSGTYTAFLGGEFSGQIKPPYAGFVAGAALGLHKLAFLEVDR